MPKHDAWSPKGISNRIKSKGLQKLRWYCQICLKQCRDENGFKCHTISEGHQRQMLLGGSDLRKVTDEYSREFKKALMHVLRRRYGTKRVAIKRVYDEYISDKNAVHMNGTCWASLTGFALYLNKTGEVVADETEKGWFITWVDRGPETLAREKALAKKKKMEETDEEETMRFIERQAGRARMREPDENDDAAEGEPSTSKELNLNHTKIEVKLASKATTDSAVAAPVIKTAFPLMVAKTSATPLKKAAVPKKRCALDELRDEEERVKEAKNRKDYWLHEGIVVKVMTKKLGEVVYKQKGVVVKVQDSYTGVVRLLESGDELSLDQAYTETVIPAIGKPVLIVNGAYRGHRAILESLDEKHFAVAVRIAEGRFKRRLVERVAYEDVCKLAEPVDDDEQAAPAKQQKVA